MVVQVIQTTQVLYKIHIETYISNTMNSKTEIKSLSSPY